MELPDKWWEMVCGLRGSVRGWRDANVVYSLATAYLNDAVLEEVLPHAIQSVESTADRYIVDNAGGRQHMVVDPDHPDFEQAVQWLVDAAKRDDLGLILHPTATIDSRGVLKDGTDRFHVVRVTFFFATEGGKQ